MRNSLPVGCLLCALASLVMLFTAGCGSDDESATGSSLVLFSTEGEHLNAYDLTQGLRKQAVVTGGEDEHAGGLSLNGQVCFDPKRSRRFVVSDDAGQPAIPPGWSVLQLHGGRVGQLSVSALGRLTPTYQQDRDPVGCAFLSDGRLLTSDIGDNAAGPATGQLTLWFNPLAPERARFCKLDTTIGTAGGIYVDAAERIYIASARVEPGIYRYEGPFPSSDDANGGCGQRDAGGAPLADQVRRQRFIAMDAHARTPTGIAAAPNGGFYVASVFNGTIVEYSSQGLFVREILRPPPGDKPAPYMTGSPFSIAVGPDGSIYYADLGLVVDGLNIGPGHGAGTVRRIRFVSGQPQPPETIDKGLNFPDGVGFLRMSDGG
jgi:hypothetical protein